MAAVLQNVILRTTYLIFCTSESRSEIPWNFRNVGLEEGWWKSVGPILWEMKYWEESKKKGTYYMR